MALTEKITAIADAIRSKTGDGAKLSLAQMAEGIAQVYKKGDLAGYLRGWDEGTQEIEFSKQFAYNEGFAYGKYQGYQSGKEEGLAEGIAQGEQKAKNDFWDKVPVTTQKYLFAGPAWNVDTFFPTKSYSFSGNQTDHMFSIHGVNAEPYDLAERLDSCGVVFNFGNITRANYMFYNTVFTRLPEIDLSKCSKLTNTFAGNKKLHTIDYLFLTENIDFENAFQGCTALENLEIVGVIGQNGLDLSDSPLTKQSILSVLNALKSGFAGTLTLGQANLDKLTAGEKAIATDKGWQLV